LTIGWGRGQYYVPEIDRDLLLSTVRTLSEKTPQIGCRTMDNFHVACAHQLRAVLFISFDERQRKSLHTRVSTSRLQADTDQTTLSL